MPRRNIFIKIYFGFWLATTLVMVTQMSLERWLELRPSPPFVEKAIGPALAFYGRSVLECGLWERAGNGGSLEDELVRSSGVHPYLIDTGGEEVHGRPLPHDALQLADRSFRSGRVEASYTPERLVMAVPISAVDGTPYFVVGEVLHEPMGPPPPMGPQGILRILVFMIVSGGVCYGLARYLTTPILKIREATRRFAAGELDLRIGREMAGRRDELSDLGNDFDIMAERIKSLITLQWQLLGDVSHELRSPMTRLRVAVELLKRPGYLNYGRVVDRIEKEIDRLNDLIGQVLTLTRLEIGREGVGMTPVDVGQLVEEIVVDGDFEARGRSRSVQLVETASCRVMGNEVMLRRAIENVLRNAIRYTAEGTAVEVRLRSSAESSCDTVEIRVRDHGSGVPDSDLEKLFLPFYRVSRARERQSGGMGLGLAITDRSVRLHRGTVTANNVPEGGLLVTIILPQMAEGSESPDPHRHGPSPAMK
jgi:two-component system sensor histidine kinase CpxA